MGFLKKDEEVNPAGKRKQKDEYCGPQLDKQAIMAEVLKRIGSKRSPRQRGPRRGLPHFAAMQILKHVLNTEAHGDQCNSGYIMQILHENGYRRYRNGGRKFDRDPNGGGRPRTKTEPQEKWTSTN